MPVPIAFGLWLYAVGQRREYLHFAIVFLLVNLLGFAGYYIHPAAPPWYVAQYGFEPIMDTGGNVAGLPDSAKSQDGKCLRACIPEMQMYSLPCLRCIRHIRIAFIYPCAQNARHG